MCSHAHVLTKFRSRTSHAGMRTLRRTRLRSLTRAWRRAPDRPRELCESHRLRHCGRCVEDSIRLAAERPCRHCQCAPSYPSSCSSTCATANVTAHSHRVYLRARAGKVSRSFGSCECARRDALASTATHSLRARAAVVRLRTAGGARVSVAFGWALRSGSCRLGFALVGAASYTNWLGMALLSPSMCRSSRERRGRCLMGMDR